MNQARQGETQVYRMVGADFDTNKCYEFALKTRTEGRDPNETYFSSNQLKYLGKYVSSERWGYRNSSGGAENFDNNGVATRIVLDGNSCFREVPCKPSNETFKKKSNKAKSTNRNNPATNKSSNRNNQASNKSSNNKSSNNRVKLGNSMINRIKKQETQIKKLKDENDKLKEENDKLKDEIEQLKNH